MESGIVMNVLKIQANKLNKNYNEKQIIKDLDYLSHFKYPSVLIRLIQFKQNFTQCLYYSLFFAGCFWQ